MQHAEFLDPKLSVETLDVFVARESILRAISDAASDLKGVMLDVGCGACPYKPFYLSRATRVSHYLGLDLYNGQYQSKPDLYRDGRRVPLLDDSVDCAVATEVLEHCPEPDIILSEIHRVLKTGATFFFTVPFLWPLHDAPHDEYRYTPWALERHLRNAGFASVELTALGGWDASLAQMLGLWARRRPMTARKRNVISWLVKPIMAYLLRRDFRPATFGESTMISGLAGTAVK